MEIVDTVPSRGRTKQYMVGVAPTKLDDIAIRTAILKADDDNSGNIYVCIEDENCSTSNGFRLKAGQGISIDIDNLGKIYVVADSDNQKLHVLWVA